MLPQKPVTLHHLLVGWLVILRQPVAVMERLGPVEAEADGKTFPGEKPAPIFVEEHAVRLNGVDDACPPSLVFSLQFNDPAEIVQAKGRRFSPMPGEVDDRLGRDFEVLADIFLQQVIGHTIRRSRGIQ